MSTIYVIQLISEPVGDDNRLKEEELYDDDLVKTRTDYVRGEADGKETEEVICGIARLAAPVAMVDTKKRTLTFKTPAEVAKAYLEEFTPKVNAHLKKLTEGKINHWEFRKSIDCPFGIDTLVYGAQGNFCCTFADVIEDYTKGYIDRTLHIGSVISCHY